MKKILVTGASGFIGSHIAEHLVRHGHDVVGVARTKRASPDGFKFLAHDLAVPLDIAGEFDAVIHAAALTKKIRGTFRELWKNNVLATANILDFAISRKVPRLLFLSSADVFGDGASGIVNEDSPIINPNPYGITKYSAELLLQEQDSVHVTSLRLPGVVGAGASGVWLANMIDRLAANDPVTIYSPEFETANFVHLDELSKFCEIMLSGNGAHPQTLVLACKEKESVLNVAEYAKNALASHSPIRIGEALKPPFCLDASRAFSVGYVSRNPLEIVDAFLRDAKAVCYRRH